jgi:phenylacetate-CoA ligase
MPAELSEAERFPLLTDRGRKLLHRLAEDSAAPLWNWPCGDQLDAAGLEQVRAFARTLSAAPVATPAWLGSFVDFCQREVPFYRKRGVFTFEEMPTTSRADLADRPWEFVPDGQPLDDLLVYRTSGSTGQPARVLSHPVAASSGLPLLELVLARRGITFQRGHEHAAFMNLCSFESAYTGPLVLSYLDEAGYARINLLPSAWRHPNDRVRFLDHWRPPILTSDPLALSELARLPLPYQPQLILSSAMTLAPAFARQMEQRFGCAIVDLYALAEVGILAVGTEQGHEVLPPDVYVEVVDEEDAPCPPGVRGEVTVTGGRNPFLPLLRYRTGDFAMLERHADHVELIGLEGRPPCLFRTGEGLPIHSMQVSRALRSFPLVQFGLHQESDGTLRFRYRGDVETRLIEKELRELFGAKAAIVFEPLGGARRGRFKVSQFTVADSASSVS